MDTAYKCGKTTLDADKKETACIGDLVLVRVTRTSNSDFISDEHLVYKCAKCGTKVEL